jgi:hypothetical protein
MKYNFVLPQVNQPITVIAIYTSKPPRLSWFLENTLEDLLGWGNWARLL